MNEKATTKIIKQEYILFKLSNEYYSVRIETLDRIIPTPTIRLVPNLADYIIGVIDIEEQIVPVLDLKKRMKLSNSSISTSVHEPFILIFEQAGRLVGFAADEIFELKQVEETPKSEFAFVTEEVHMFSDGTLRIEDENFLTIGRNKEELIVVLNLKKIHDIIKKELSVDGDL